MKNFDVVDAETLLSEFFRRAAKNENANGHTVRRSVMTIVEDLVSESKVQHALEA